MLALAARASWGELYEGRRSGALPEREEWALSKVRAIAAEFHVLSHWGDAASILMPEDLAGQVSVTPLLGGGIIPTGPFDVLLTFGSPAPELGDVLALGIPWVHITATGVDEFPLEQLGAVELTNNRGGAGRPISEWVLATMLAFEKRLPDTWITEPTENWYLADLGSLDGATLAVLGFGSIGQAVARKALAFDMNVKAMRRTNKPSPIPDVSMVGSLDELLPGARHFLIAAPLTQATRHLIDTSAFALMDDGVHLVNVSRGEIVDQEALRTALEAGVVRRASLDAVDPEPPPDNHWLYTHPGVKLSPHVSNNAPDAFNTMMNTFWGEVRRRLAGQPLLHTVDASVGY